MDIEGGHPTALIRLQSFLIVVGTAVGGLVALRGFRIQRRLFMAAFIENVSTAAREEKEELFDALEVLEVLERTSLVARKSSRFSHPSASSTRCSWSQRRPVELRIAP